MIDVSLDLWLLGGQSLLATRNCDLAHLLLLLLLGRHEHEVLCNLRLLYRDVQLLSQTPRAKGLYLCDLGGLSGLLVGQGGRLLLLHVVHVSMNEHKTRKSYDLKLLPLLLPTELCKALFLGGRLHARIRLRPME